MMLTPDGVRYLAMARGSAQPMPFHLRFGLPAICGDKPAAWIAATWCGLTLAVCGTGILAYQHGLGIERAILAAAFVAFLPAVRFAADAPVLTDGASLGLSVAAAVIAPYSLAAAIVVALLGAAVNERVPVWAALFALEPVLLCGLAFPLVRLLLVRAPAVSDTDPHRDILRTPVKAGLKSHAGKWLDARLMLAPWGVCLLALLAPSPWLLLALVLAYAQCLVATDTVRLYQQAAPAVAIVAAAVVPDGWLLAAGVAHSMNPWRGNGL